MPESTPIRLTKHAKRAGCAAKQPPGYLLPLLGQLPGIIDRNVLVGTTRAPGSGVDWNEEAVRRFSQAEVHA